MFAKSVNSRSYKNIIISIPDLDLSKILAPLRTKRNADVAPLAFIIMAAGRGARQIGQLLRVLHRKQNIYIILVHVVSLSLPVCQCISEVRFLSRIMSTSERYEFTISILLVC